MMTSPEEAMSNGLEVIHDAVEAFCDGDEALVLAHLNRLCNGPAAAAVAYMIRSVHYSLHRPDDDPRLAGLLARGRLRNCLSGIQADLAVNSAAMVIHDALREEGLT